MVDISRRAFIVAGTATVGVAALEDFIWSAPPASAEPYDPILDRLVFGDAASETAHGLDAQLSDIVAGSSGALGQSARVFNPTTPASYWGGGVKFTLSIDPDLTNYVSVKLWGGDFNPADGKQWRLHLYAEDGTEVKQVGYQEQGVIDSLDILGAEPRSPERFFIHTIPLPEHLTRGKTTIRVEIRANGRIWSYGGTPSSYFYNLTESSRPVYSVYTHTSPYFTPDPGDVFGAAVQPKQRPESETTEIEAAVRSRVERNLAALADTGDVTRFDGWQIQELAEAYLWSDPEGRNPAFGSDAAFERTFRAIDGRYRAWKGSSNELTSSSQQWQGFGRLGLALYLLGEGHRPKLDAALDKVVSGSARTVLNPGFEEGSSTATGWSKVGWLSNQGAIAKDDQQARPGSVGTSSLRISNAAGQVTIVDSSTAMPVTAGQSYYFSAWIKTSGAEVTGSTGAALNLIFYNDAGTIVPINGVNDHRAWALKTSSSVDWNVASVTLTAPPGATRVRTSARFWGAGTAWFDDVFFADISAGGMLANPGFELGSGVPAGWSTVGWLPNQAPLSIDTATARPNSSGSRSLTFANTTDTQVTIVEGSRVAIEPGSDVLVGGWVKTSNLSTTAGKGVALNVILYDGAGQIVPYNGANDTRIWAQSNEWTFVSAQFAVPDGVTRVDVSLRMWGTGQAWFDDVIVVPANVDLAVEGTPTRRVAYGDMMTAHWNHWRRSFPHYTNQVQICATGLYQVARALQLYFPDRIAELEINGSDIEAEARAYVEEAVGLRPWHGKLEEDWVTRRAYLGDSYRQVTTAGLTREIGFVGNYGEVTDWLVHLWEAISRGEGGLPVDDPWLATVRERILSIIRVRFRFRVVDVDAEGFRVAQEQTVIGWRNEEFPGKDAYIQPTVWDGNPLQAVTTIASADPEFVGITREMFADGQLGPALTLLRDNGSGRVGLNAFRFVAHHRPEWDVVDRSAPATRYPALPTAWGQPDFVFADPESGVVALKNGEEIVWAATYYRARQGINSYGRVHHLTPALQRSATVRIFADTRPYVAPPGYDGPLDETFQSATYTLRGDLLNFDYAISDVSAPAEPGLFSLPADPLGRALSGNALGGVELPRARLAADILDPTNGLSARDAIETLLVGRPEIAVLTYGRYLVIVNSTQSSPGDPAGGKTYNVTLPGKGKARVLYWGGPSVLSNSSTAKTALAAPIGGRIKLGKSISVEPLSVVVIHADSEIMPRKS